MHHADHKKDPNLTYPFTRRGMGLFLATSGDYQLAIDTDNIVLHFDVGPGAKPRSAQFPR
jgi:hypothetical protein